MKIHIIVTLFSLATLQLGLKTFDRDIAHLRIRIAIIQAAGPAASTFHCRKASE